MHDAPHRTHAVKGSSDRGFGLVLAAVFLIIGLWPLTGALLDPGAWAEPGAWAAPRIWSLAVAGAFLGVALAAPRRLAPLNWLWMGLGVLLGRIVNPIVMGVVFFLVVTPIALIRRLMGRESLLLRFDPKVGTYWVNRTPPGPPPETMKHQF